MIKDLLGEKLSDGWIDATIQLPPIDKPSLILLENGTQHVGYPEKFNPRYGQIEWRWIVGGWESCNTCSGRNTIVFREAEYYQARGTHWKPLNTQ